MNAISSVSSATPSAGAANSASDDKKIDKSSKEFESLLLSTWLEKAYDSFGSVPGSEDDEELNSGKEQYNSMGMQSLAQTLTESGGIGIATMIAKHLHRQSDTGAAAQASALEKAHAEDQGKKFLGTTELSERGSR